VSATIRTALAATLVVVAALVAHVPAQAPVFRSGIEMVRVDVLVSTDGRPLLGLEPADFEILDNGIPQQVEFAGLEQLPLNVTFALDTSASVAGPALAHLQEASGAVLDGLTGDDRAALVAFSHTVALRSPLTARLEDVRRAVVNVMPRGDTALIDAVYAGIVVAEAEIGRKLLLVFTDGYDTSSYLTRQEVAEAARTTDVVVYTVTAGVTGHHTTEFLSDVAGLTGGGLVEVETAGDMRSAFVGILDEFRHRYLLTFSPRGVAKTGWHRLEVRVKGRPAVVKARTGYQADF
jgi:VWFA-related protein